MSKKPTPKAKAAVGPSLPAPTRLLVKKELIRTGAPPTYDGKRLYDAIDRLTTECLFLLIAGFIMAVVGLVFSQWWMMHVGLTAFPIGVYGFSQYMKFWEGNKNDETVTEQLYVELPPRLR